MSNLRVLIVDDAVVIRRLLSDCLTGDPEIEVAATAASGPIALAQLDAMKIDLVTLDIEMEPMDGLETLRAIRKKRPDLPVIMFSTLSERGAAATLDALALGANDYVTKPANVGSVTAAVKRIRDELIPKIKALCHRSAAARVRTMEPVLPPPPKRIELAPPSVASLDVLAIGVSTGGPNALATLLPLLAHPFPAPILIVQHMPPLFTRLLADRLAALTGRVAREGVAGAVPKPGEIWVAPGGLHMEVDRVDREVRLVIHEGPAENSCRPAVDVLFRSVAAVYGGRALAVVLTGMGQDGLIGCRHIREAGGHVLAQDEATSVVWGMPGAVAHAGLAEGILPLAELAVEINRRAGPAPRRSLPPQPELVHAT